MRFALARDERPVSAVPRSTKLVLAVALTLQIGWHAMSPKPLADAAALGYPPDGALLQAASLGEPIALSQLLVLYLQAFDNQPGVSIPYQDLDYDAVEAWLQRALELDPAGQYPLLMASHLYDQVPDEAKVRLMLEFVHRQFFVDPNQRWRWLAHAALIAKHRLADQTLALQYADDITRHAGDANAWARQMGIFMRVEMGACHAAKELLAALLESGEVVPESAEHRFLKQRREELICDEKSSLPSKSR